MCLWFAVPEPHNEIRHGRNAAQFSEPGCILRAMVMAVHRYLHEGVPTADLQRRIEPRDLDNFLHSTRTDALKALVKIRKALPGITLQSGGVGEFLRLLVFELRGRRTGDPEERMLHDVNVMKALEERFVSQRRGVCFECTPMFRICPFLMGK